MRDALTVRIILGFFLPLLFMTELQQISHSIVHAFLARLADPKVILAAFSIAFAFNFTLCGLVHASQQMRSATHTFQGGIQTCAKGLTFKQWKAGKNCRRDLCTGMWTGWPSIHRTAFTS